MKTILTSLALTVSMSATALDCGTFTFPKCDGHPTQFHESFNPRAPYGGFGGADDCIPQRTPIIFVHGNGDHATNWDSPGRFNQKSMYDALKEAGWKDCELFGVTYLSEKEQADFQNNYHKPEKYNLILDFIEDVRLYTGRPKVTIIGHSLGVSMSMAALLWANEWKHIDSFVNIAGGIKGLASCLPVGPANPLIKTCLAQNPMRPFEFGFYPYGNTWMGRYGRYSLSTMPQHFPNVKFYTIHAGKNDQVHCSIITDPTARCEEGALYEDAPNVIRQVDVGQGKYATLNNLHGGDDGGIGHFGARNETGSLIIQFLSPDGRH